MTGTQKAIIPGIILSSLMLIFLSRLTNPPLEVSAATQSPQNIIVDHAANTEFATQSECQFFSRYPEQVQPWCALIESSALKYGVDPFLIASVMLIESGGQPEVMSHSGAVGLMQVMPRDGIASTFQCINGPCFANRPTIQELKDPGFNVDYGVRMLAGLTEREGNIRDALKSYGPYDVGYSYADKVINIFSSLIR